MLASQVIERYQAFCPSSLAMEGDVKGCKLVPLIKRFNVSWWLWIFVRQQWQRRLIKGGFDYRQARSDFSSNKGFGG